MNGRPKHYILKKKETPLKKEVAVEIKEGYGLRPEPKKIVENKIKKEGLTPVVAIEQKKEEEMPMMMKLNEKVENKKMNAATPPIKKKHKHAKPQKSSLKISKEKNGQRADIPGPVGDQGESIFIFHKTEVIKKHLKHQKKPGKHYNSKVGNVRKGRKQTKLVRKARGVHIPNLNKTKPGILIDKIPLLEEAYLTPEGIKRIYSNERRFQKFYHVTDKLLKNLQNIVYRLDQYSKEYDTSDATSFFSSK
eukprot:TRINITY_DN715_c0_g1_i1.p1 TRINITY_DN715_c0_g1~~TRINITY_DN715_c0_g1_i1.p1  ORF type:complete len:291 (-),score=84.44 TRINITY_DN715_c0_g1_i1:53-799(-)